MLSVLLTNRFQALFNVHLRRTFDYWGRKRGTMFQPPITTNQ